MACPRCRSAITYLNQDGDEECICGFVVYLTATPPTLEDMAAAARAVNRRREPMHGKLHL